MDISYAILVKIGEGQRLQMGKRCVAQVHVDPDLHLHPPDTGKVVKTRRGNNGSKIHEEKKRHASELSFGDKMVERVALKKRYRNIDEASKRTEGNHADHLTPVISQIGLQRREPEPPCSLHGASS